MASPPDRRLGYQALEPVVRALVPSTPLILMGEFFLEPVAMGIAADPLAHLPGLVTPTSLVRRPVAPLAPVCAVVLVARAVADTGAAHHACAQRVRAALRRCAPDASPLPRSMRQPMRCACRSCGLSGRGIDCCPPLRQKT